MTESIEKIANFVMAAATQLVEEKGEDVEWPLVFLNGDDGRLCLELFPGDGECIVVDAEGLLEAALLLEFTSQSDEYLGKLAEAVDRFGELVKKTREKHREAGGANFLIGF